MDLSENIYCQTIRKHHGLYFDVIICESPTFGKSLVEHLKPTVQRSVTKTGNKSS